MFTKLHIKLIFTIISFISFPFTIISQNENTDLWKNEIFKDYSPKNEILTQRSENSKHFVNVVTGENEAFISNGFLHYQEKDKWLTIYNTIESNYSEKNNSYAYANLHNTYQTFYPAKINSLGILTAWEKNDIIDFINPVYYFANNMQEKISTPIGAKEVSAEISKNKLTYPAIFDKIDAVFTQHSKQRKLDFIIQDRSVLSTAPPQTEYMVFEETIELPDNWSLQLSENRDEIYVFNEKLEYVCKASKPRFIENTLNQERIDSIQSSITAPICLGKYSIKQQENKYIISVLVPFAWLNYTHRKYPVSIDPTWDYTPNNIAYWSGTIRTGNFLTHPSGAPTMTNIFQVFNDYLSLSCYGYIYDPYYGDYETYWDHSFSMFNISSIPSGSTINSANFTINPSISTHIVDGAPFGIYFRDFTSNSLTDPFANILTDIRSGSIYYTTNLRSLWNNGNFTNIALPANSISEIQARLPTGRYGLGFHAYSGANYWDSYAEFHGRSSIYAPYITITYTNPLPVQLISFENICNNQKIDLKWSTASEKNNAYFIIDKSYDAINWSYVGRETGSGNSNEVKNYFFTDYDAANSVVYYRLTQVDMDGKTEKFPPISIQKCNTHMLPSTAIYPNPTAALATIEIQSPVAISDANLSVIDVNGKVVQTISINLSEGNNTIAINTELWAAGVYGIQITNTAEVAFEALKLVKQ